jgi:hypothetical protein
MPRRALAVLFAVVGLIAAVAAAPAPAAPPHASVGACSSPTLTGPGAVSAGVTYTIEGCGFGAGSLVPLEFTEGGGCCIAYNIGADASGRFSVTRTAWSTGYYRVRAAAQRRNGRWVTVAQWSFSAS